MKKFHLIWVLAALFVLTACIAGKAAVQNEQPPTQAPEEAPDASGTQTEPQAHVLSADEALEAVRAALGDAFADHQIELNDDELMIGEESVYQFLVSDSEITLEPSLIVHKTDGLVETYYPDGTIYLLALDPVFGTPLDWTGTFVRGTAGADDAATLTIEAIDTTSIEFSLAAANGQGVGGVETRTARLDLSKPGSAQFEEDGFTLRFSYDGERITLSEEGENPFAGDGVTFAGVYTRQGA